MGDETCFLGDGRARGSTLCAIHKGIQDHLFERLAAASPAAGRLLASWTQVRTREHHLHLPQHT